MKFMQKTHGVIFALSAGISLYAAQAWSQTDSVTAEIQCLPGGPAWGGLAGSTIVPPGSSTYQSVGKIQVKPGESGTISVAGMNNTSATVIRVIGIQGGANFTGGLVNATLRKSGASIIDAFLEGRSCKILVY